MDKVEQFLSVDYGYGYGDGIGNGSGYGYGIGYGDGNGYGDGIGNGSGYGYGIGYGDGNGYGDGIGYGNGYGNGNGYGIGYGDGNGYGDGIGNGSGNGSEISEFCGAKVFLIDDVPTIIEHVRGNFAKCFTIKYNSQLVPCYVAKVGYSFAHGETLKKAFDDAQAKEFSRVPMEKRVELFVAEHHDANEVIANSELFKIHNMLTGSCEFGRKQFCERNGINLDDSMTIRRFIELTCNEYGGKTINLLNEKYNDKDT